MNIGQYVHETLPTPLRYIGTVTGGDIPLVIIIPVVAGGPLIVVFLSMLIICCVVCYHRRKSKKNEQRWTNLLSQMELMELEMADECKRGELIDWSVCVRLRGEGKRERERERSTQMWEWNTKTTLYGN